MSVGGTGRAVLSVSQASLGATSAGIYTFDLSQPAIIVAGPVPSRGMAQLQSVAIVSDPRPDLHGRPTATATSARTPTSAAFFQCRGQLLRDGDPDFNGDGDVGPTATSRRSSGRWRAARAE
jgi:hypothetical protein